jgi:hypothetical protein
VRSLAQLPAPSPSMSSRIIVGVSALLEKVRFG